MTEYEHHMKYHLTEAEERMLYELERKRAYMILHDALESGCYYQMELTEEEIEAIIYEFLDNRNGEVAVERIEQDMDDAIRHVKESLYELEVRYVTWETTTVVAMSEEEAHQMVKERFERSRDNIVGVNEITTLCVDDATIIEGQHTTKWEV